MVELVVFDWNGTLIADTEACRAADNHVLKTFGGTPVDLKTYRETIIIPAVNFYTLHGCNRDDLLANAQKLGKTFHVFYEPRAAKVRTRAGTRAMLGWLPENQIPAVLLSNHTVEGVDAQLHRLGLSQYFREVIANSLGNASMLGRNKREKLEVYLEKNHHNPGGVVIIGDSPEEPEIAKKLGLIGVAIAGGYYAASRLRAAQPNFLIHGMNEFIGVIEKVNSSTK